MLKTKDLYLFTKALRKMNLKDDLKDILKNIKPNDESNLGLEVCYLIVSHLDLGSTEINEIISNYTNKKIQDIENQNLTETLNDLKLLFSDKEIISFFKSAMQ